MSSRHRNTRWINCKLRLRLKLKLHLKTAIRNLTAAPLRSFLAMLGIMVGTASVVALISGGQLATQQALAQIKSLGTDLMRIDLQSTNDAGNTDITPEEIIALKDSVPGILQVAPVTTVGSSGSFQQTLLDSINVIGVTENLADVIHIQMQAGRFIYDLDKAQNFCVLGADVASQLKTLDLVGHYFKIQNFICTIIGITDTWPENNIVNLDINKSVMIPLSALLQNFSNVSINTAILSLDKKTSIDAVKAGINDYFTKNSPQYTVSIQSAKELLNSISKQQTIFTLLLGLIGGVSLLVGGIGVMNIMLASVAERHAEIGLRIALGAKPLDVQLMFIMEAATLAILGGGLGVAVGLFATATIAYFAHWGFVLLIWPPLIGFTVSLIISLFFGFYPAYVASKLNPIETLRT